jgi:hypothetical protein
MISPVVYAVVAALAMYATYMGIINAIELVSTGVKTVMTIAEYAHAAATKTAVAATTAETAAQLGLNTALLSCPLTWIIVLVIALIAVIIAVTNYIANMGGTASTAFGVITGGINVVIQFFKNLGVDVANIALGIGNAIAALGSNIVAAFHNSIANVQTSFYDLLATALNVISQIASALSALPFVDFDASGIANVADDYAAKAAAAQNSKMDYQSISQAYQEGASTFNRGSYSDAYASGAKWGDSVSNKVKNTVSSKATTIPSTTDYSSALATGNSNTAATAANTADAADSASKAAKSVEMTGEDLKYLRDIAERDVVNRYTTASINVNMTNNNTINNDMDLDGVTEHLRSTIEEQMNAAAEGVY